MTTTKACDAHCVCDLSGTIEHMLSLRHSLSLKDFEQYVRSLDCYRYAKTPKYFVASQDIPSKKKKVGGASRDKPPNKHKECGIGPNKEPKKHKSYNKNKLNWPWITNGKTSDGGNGNEEPKTLHKDTIDNVLVNFLVDDDFEKFYKGEHGIYRTEESKRKRRTVDEMDLTEELTDLPPLQSGPNEVLTMDGDSVVLECSELLARHDGSDEGVTWSSEPDHLMRRPNVKIEGNALHIDNVRGSNAGSYVCKEGDRIRRNAQVTVLALPTFVIVVSPMYLIQEKTCTYKDLRAIRSLSSAMSQLVCPGGHCAVAVHDPNCLRDVNDGCMLIRAIASLKVEVPDVACGASCKRDLMTRLVRLAVEDMPKMINVDVLIQGAANKTLLPSSRVGPFAVTRKLSRRGIPKRRGRELSPGNVDVTVSCQRGYQLLPRLKICVADISSADKTKKYWKSSRRPTRSGGGTLRVGTGRRARRRRARAARARCARSSRTCWRAPSAATGPVHPAGNRRPVSPSRVILARLFKRSLSAFRHTDSQETRAYPSKPVPPPLPPIDFD